MTSTSDTSGSSAAEARTYSAGRSCAGSSSGTSQAGSECAWRPGAESSKISLSYAGRAVVMGAASGHGPAEGRGERVDLLAGPVLGHRHEERALEGAIEGLQRHAGEDAIPEQPLHHPLRRLRQLERELLEEGGAESQPDPGDLRQLSR